MPLKFLPAGRVIVAVNLVHIGEGAINFEIAALEGLPVLCGHLDILFRGDGRSDRHVLVIGNDIIIGDLRRVPEGRAAEGRRREKTALTVHAGIGM